MQILGTDADGQEEPPVQEEEEGEDDEVVWEEETIEATASSAPSASKTVLEHLDQIHVVRDRAAAAEVLQRDLERLERRDPRRTKASMQRMWRQSETSSRAMQGSIS